MKTFLLDKTKWGWWQNAVFYQIYPKSFQDTTGSGIGDLNGITQHLDYLAELGIDGIWLSPVFASPQVDNGYDISDYRAIDPMFGSMEDMKTLIAEAKKRGISIIMDLVLNHSSNQHFWFREALKGRDNPYHDFYVWQDGTPDVLPTDMDCAFGGPAWTWVEELGQYYYHQFAKEQPDLNWDNPRMRQELYAAIRMWVALGVEGFRLDVIDQIAKVPMERIHANGPRLHEFLQELSREAFGEKGLVTVGEAWSADVERAKRYSNPDASELSMVFQFEHILLDQIPGMSKWDSRPLYLPDLKACFNRWQQGLHNQGWNSLFLNNHDLPRIVSRWGNDKEYRVESAKMLATMLHGMEGTPYIYQGEELGMTNIRLPLDKLVDLESINAYQERLKLGRSPEDAMEDILRKARDNARTPMQWNDAPNAGFTTGTPWMTVNPNYLEINAEAALADPDSVFHYYRRLIDLRKTMPVIAKGWFSLVDDWNEHVFAYTRDFENQHLLVICNFSGNWQPYELPARFQGAQLLLSNYETTAPGLLPYEAAMLYYED